MSVERNKAVVSRLYDEVINLEMPSVINMIFAQDVVIHDPFMGTVHGVAAFHQLMAGFNCAFPNHRVDVHAIIGDGEWISVLHTHWATHTGPFLGAPGTGRSAKVSGVEIFRVVNARIVECWRHDDDAGLLMQLGLLPLGQGA